MHVYIEIGYINKMLTFDHNLQRQNSKFEKTFDSYSTLQLTFDTDPML